MYKILKMCYNERHVAINLPQNTSPLFEDTYPVCLNVLNQLKKFTFDGHFDYLRPKSCKVPDLMNKMGEDISRHQGIYEKMLIKRSCRTVQKMARMREKCV